MKSTEEQVAELEGRVAELEKLTDELKDVCLMSRTNNVRLAIRIDQMRHSIPLDVWRNRLRFVYPDSSIERIEELVRDEAEEREAWILDRQCLTKKDVLEGYDREN